MAYTLRLASRSPSAVLPACGFTLVELVVSVAVFGLLSALAYSSYDRYMIRANRSAAEQFMTDIALREAEYLLDARSYASVIGTGGLNLSVPSKVAANYNVTVTVN